MAAVAGEAARLELDIDDGSLRGSFSYKKQSYGFLMNSSSSLSGDVLLTLRLRFVGKIRRARATIYRAFGTDA
jgi:hypothetical protein